MPAIIQKLMASKYVLANLVARDLIVKYRGTVLGYLWSLLEPLSLVLVYYFVFVVIARASDPHYPLTVILGVLPYNLMAGIINGGAGALTSNAALIKRVYIPREVFVFATVASNLVLYSLSLLVIVPFMIAYKVLPGFSLLWLVPAIIGLSLLSTGVALFVACANAIYRDVGYVLRVALRILFYTSPVIYSAKNVPDHMRELFLLLNPSAVWISIHRSAFVAQPLDVRPAHLAIASAVTLLVFVTGSMFFTRYEKQAVKFL